LGISPARNPDCDNELLSIVSAPNAGRRTLLLGQELSSVADSATLAGVGGALDAFTYLGHGHVFANAMTGNVVLLGLNAVQGDWRHSLYHLLPILSFFLGVSTAKAIELRLLFPGCGNPDRAVLNFEIAIFAILGCLPSSAPHLLITVSVAFAASMQTQTFRNVEGDSYNSTFTTGNLRSLSEDTFVWLVRKMPRGLRRPAQIFAIICGAFLLGVLAGGLMVPLLYNRTLWPICAVLLFLRRRLATSHFPAAA
jgi:uncharacterized membrane protein YoaK (UPF0700 family)